MPLSLDAEGIIAKYGEGSATGMARRMTERGYKLTKQAVSRWRSIDGLPMRAWLTICEVELEETGKIPDLRIFLRRIKGE